MIEFLCDGFKNPYGYFNAVVLSIIPIKDAGAPDTAVVASEVAYQPLLRMEW